MGMTTGSPDRFTMKSTPVSVGESVASPVKGCWAGPYRSRHADTPASKVSAACADAAGPALGVALGVALADPNADALEVGVALVVAVEVEVGVVDEVEVEGEALDDAGGAACGRRSHATSAQHKPRSAALLTAASPTPAAPAASP